MKIPTFLLGVLLLGAGMSEARAELPKQPEHAVSYRNLTAARINPLGLVDVFRLSYRHRLYEHDSLVLRQNYVGLGLAGGVSPAWYRLGPILEHQPLTVLRLWASYTLVQYFGTFNLLASFPDASADFSDTAVERRADEPGTKNLATSGTELTLGSDFQIKVGPAAVRVFTRAYRADMDLRDGDNTFYDQFYDVLMPNGGWVLTNDTDLLWVSDFGLVAGVRYSYAKPFYEERHRGGPTGPSNVLHRAGPILAYQLGDTTTGRSPQPTLVLLTQWHFEHRWRTGRDVSRSMPYLGLAFVLRGDLLN